MKSSCFWTPKELAPRGIPCFLPAAFAGSSTRTRPNLLENRKERQIICYAFHRQTRLQLVHLTYPCRQKCPNKSRISIQMATNSSHFASPIPRKRPETMRLQALDALWLALSLFEPTKHARRGLLGRFGSHRGNWLQITGNSSFRQFCRQRVRPNRPRPAWQIRR
jgi:hypothetical protein